jgi:hypothetical protein
MGERLRGGPYSRQTENEGKGGAAGSSESKVYRSRKRSEGVQGTSETTEGCLVRSVDGRVPSDGSQGRHQGQVVD